MSDLNPLSLNEIKELSKNSPDLKMWVLESDCVKVVTRKNFAIKSLKARINELEKGND